MFYRVKIEKKRYTDPFDKLSGSYHWEVECFKDANENTRQEWDLRGGGFAHSVNGAKKKALKHLMGVDKDVKAGLQFGVLFEVAGTAEEVKEKLQ